MQAGLTSGSVSLSQLTKPFLVTQIRIFVVKRMIAGIEIQAREAQLILQCRKNLPHQLSNDGSQFGVDGKLLR